MIQGNTHSGEIQTNRQEINQQVSIIDGEIASIDKEIENLRKLRTTLVTEREELLGRLKNTSTSHPKNPGGRGIAGINYNESFEWSEAMKARMKVVFGIESFRLCQEAVCNSNMDSRDIVCVMPTGGGKSLTYQLPALLTPGCTLVISPLISLITDQIIHLREAGVEAVMLTGSTTKDESREITLRMTQGAEGDKEIKLCYVTPEKISKSKTFVSVLEKMVTKGRLARIVIDEAHCVSQLGHDFRPDYKKLSMLRTLFPRVPILALSATCPPAVLKDLLQVLRLKPVVDGSNAPPEGTVYFSAPLYRKNLHYKVVPKPASASAAIQTMTDYILEQHKHDSGIVYCLSKKDAETVAKGIAESSNGKIKTGVYHADIADRDKESLHRRWREGHIQVVCATIAFGLGIDMATVRFVLHHSMSKSLDGFYQESGRAGRDGKDADCVLYYRGQDATRLSALTCGEIGGQEKLYGMLRFAQNVTECRKVLFANYFSASSSLSLASWTSSTAGALTPCGHCDNCTRPPDTVERKDVTLEAWQILKIMQNIESQGGRVTLGMMADLIRGAGGGSFGTTSKSTGNSRKGKGKFKEKEKAELDLDEIAGGKVGLNKDDSETLLIHLLLLGYLKEDFHSTAYAINVYLLSGPQAMRLTRLSREAIEAGTGHLKIECVFLIKPTRKSSKGQSNTKGKGSGTGTKLSKISGSASLSSSGAQPPLNFSKSKASSSRSGQNSVLKNEKSRKKRKRRSGSYDGESVSEAGGETEEEEEEEPGEFDDFIVDDEDDGIIPSPTTAQEPREANAGIGHLSPSIFVSSDHEPVDDDEDDWTFSMRPNKRRRTANVPVVSNNEIVILSD